MHFQKDFFRAVHCTNLKILSGAVCLKCTTIISSPFPESRAKGSQSEWPVGVNGVRVGDLVSKSRTSWSRSQGPASLSFRDQAVRKSGTARSPANFSVTDQLVFLSWHFLNTQLTRWSTKWKRIKQGRRI